MGLYNMYQTHDHMEDYDSAQGDVGSRGATINSKSTRRSHPAVNRIERIQQNHHHNQQNNNSNDDLAASIRRGQQNARRNPRHHQQQRQQEEEDVETQLSPDELMARIMGHGHDDDDDDDGFSVNTGRLGGGATTVAGDELTFDGSTIATNPHQHHHLPFRHQQHHQMMGGMQMPNNINRTPSGIDLEWNRQGNNTGHHHASSLYPPKMEGTDGTDSSEGSPPYSRKSSQSSKRKKGTCCCGVSKCCLIVVLLLLLAAVGAGAGWLFLIYLPGQDSSNSSNSGAESSSTGSMSYPCCTVYNQDNWSSKQVCTEDGCCSVCPAGDSTTAAIDTLEKPKPEDAPKTEPPVKATVAPITVVTDAPIQPTNPLTVPPVVPEQEKETPRPTTTAPVVTPQPTLAPTTPFPTLAPVTPVPTAEPTDPPRVAATIPPVTPAPTAGATINGTVL